MSSNFESQASVKASDFYNIKNPTFWVLLKNSSLFSKFQAQTFQKSEPKLGLGFDPSLLTHIFRSSDDLLNLFYGWTLYVISKRQFKMHTLYPRDGPKLAYNSYLWCFSNLLSKFFLLNENRFWKNTFFSDCLLMGLYYFNLAKYFRSR